MASKKLEEEVLKSVSVGDLTPEELRRSKLPNKCINAIWVKFKSKVDKQYYAVHIYRHVRGPLDHISYYVEMIKIGKILNMSKKK